MFLKYRNIFSLFRKRNLLLNYKKNPPASKSQGHDYKMNYNHETAANIKTFICKTALQNAYTKLTA
jgi:hypothetical protein